MITTELSVIANLVVFAVCAWATCDVRVHNKTGGALCFAVLGVGALVNTAKPTFFGLLPIEAAFILNWACAIFALLYFAQWEDPRKKEDEYENRDLFREKR